MDARLRALLKTDPAILSTLMELPEADRLEIAMALLDHTSPAAMTQDEILQEAARRQDELESGAVQDISFDELVAGLSHSS